MVSMKTEDTSLRDFAALLEKEIDKYGDLRGDEALVRQQAQVEGLVGAEAKLRYSIQTHARGQSMYGAWRHWILHERRSILSARPYFRERKAAFVALSEALKDEGSPVSTLYQFHFNYLFVSWLKVRGFFEGDDAVDLRALVRDIEERRKELALLNMPLALNRARIFWSWTPASQLEYMDLVMLCAKGLLDGIDKFCLPFTRVFRSVCIGRMVGDMITSYSQTSLHFFPGDKKKIYWANKCGRGPRSEIDYDKLAVAVNEHMKPHEQTTASELSELLQAISPVSADTGHRVEAEEEDDISPASSFSAPASTQPDVLVEEAEAVSVLAHAITKLPVEQQKLLKMKGMVV